MGTITTSSSAALLSLAALVMPSCKSAPADAAAPTSPAAPTSAIAQQPDHSEPSPQHEFDPRRPWCGTMLPLFPEIANPPENPLRRDTIDPPFPGSES
jgi:hypothetical protein